MGDPDDHFEEMLLLGAVSECMEKMESSEEEDESDVSYFKGCGCLIVGIFIIYLIIKLIF